MADDPRQPVAIRVSRPYASEDEFLEREIETLTRTSVMLVGSQSRPQGVILRFEVTLANGTPILRGEGRVVGFKPRAVGDLPGLTLRFTRLDTKSKALVDRAAAIRDARARAMLQAAMGESESIFPPPLPPPAAPSEPLPITAVSRPPPSFVPPSEVPRVGSSRSPRPPGVLALNRDSLLERLRIRRTSLSAETVARILEKRARSPHESDEAPVFKGPGKK